MVRDAPQQKSAIQVGMADFVANTRFEDLPQKLVTRLKWSFLDSLGCGDLPRDFRTSSYLT